MFAKSPENATDGRLSRYDHLIVHCTATPPNLDADAAWVNRAHKARGMTGCGYQAVITRAGEWQDADSGFLTRPIGAQGAHVGDCGPGWNGRSFGVSLAGGVDFANKPDMNYTPQQMDTLEEGIDRFMQLHPHPESVVIIGHRDLIAICKAPPKACPCFDVTHWRKENGLADRSSPSQKRVVVTIDCKDEDSRSEDQCLPAPKEYTVQKGDSLWKVFHTFGVDIKRLKVLNGLQDDIIQPGQVLRLQ